MISVLMDIVQKDRRCCDGVCHYDCYLPFPVLLHHRILRLVAPKQHIATRPISILLSVVTLPYYQYIHQKGSSNHDADTLIKMVLVLCTLYSSAKIKRENTGFLHTNDIYKLLALLFIIIYHEIENLSWYNMYFSL